MQSRGALSVAGLMALLTITAFTEAGALGREAPAVPGLEARSAPRTGFWYVVDGAPGESEWVRGDRRAEIGRADRAGDGGRVHGDVGARGWHAAVFRGSRSVVAPTRPWSDQGHGDDPVRRGEALSSDPGNDPKSCCSCASWQDSQESVEALSVRGGLRGLWLRRLHLQPHVSMPAGPENVLTLKPDDGSEPTLILDEARAAITFENRNRMAVTFHRRSGLLIPTWTRTASPTSKTPMRSRYPAPSRAAARSGVSARSSAGRPRTPR